MNDKLAREILKDVSLEEIAPRTRKSSPINHWSQAVLLERAAYLRKLAKYGNGSASETIKEYPQYVAMLAFKGRSGDAEMHQAHALVFVVLSGTATLVTGGTITRAKLIGAGETRGDGIEGGERQELRAGDVIHVPAGIAHQVLIAGEKPITLLVVKIHEVE